MEKIDQAFKRVLFSGLLLACVGMLAPHLAFGQTENGASGLSKSGEGPGRPAFSERAPCPGDDIPPTVYCRNITVQLNSAGTVTIVGEQLNNGSYDNCAIASFTATPGTFDCGDVGANPVTLTATDENGNSASCQATVTVQDVIPPQGSSMSGFAASYYDGVEFDVFAASDNVPFINFNWGPGSPYPALLGLDLFSIRYQGSTFVPVTGNYTFHAATDDGLRLYVNNQLIIDEWNPQVGNFSATIFLTAGSPVPVTLEYNEYGGNAVVRLEWESAAAGIPRQVFVPMVAGLCQDVTVQLGLTGQATVSPLDIDPGFTDNCGIASRTLLPNTFDCSDVGPNAVKFTVTDINGNSSSCNATVFVEAGPGMPPPWASQNIGNPGPGNTYSFAACTLPPMFTIGAGAANNSITTDNIAFIQREICGDFQFTVKVESITPNGYAGLMARESSAAGSKQVGLYSNRSNLVRWESRVATNAGKAANFFQKPLPYWLRLVRQGSWFYAYYSYNGVNFSIVTARPVPMNSCIKVGMAAFTNIPGSTASAVFSNLQLLGSGPGILQLPDTEAAQAGIGRTISLFPNPARDIVTVEMGVTLNPGLKSGDRCPTVLRLLNELGQLLEERRLDDAAERLEWNVSQLRPGLYFLEIIEEGCAPQLLRFVKAPS